MTYAFANAVGLFATYSTHVGARWLQVSPSWPQMLAA